MALELVSGRYKLGGLDLLDLGHRYGLPLYVYDAEEIAAKYHQLVQAFPVNDLRVHYACKALPTLGILTFMRGLGAHLDAVSINEVLLGIEAGFAPKQILYTPNMVANRDVDRAIELGVNINVDNLDLLEYVGTTYPGQEVCIRINPHIMAGGNKKISVGHIDSKFGISIHQLPMAERLVKSLGVPVVGMHMHNGSDILDAEVFLMAAEILFNSALPFIDTITYLDFGSGFKVRYYENDIETDIEGLGIQMAERFHAFTKEIGKDLALVFEPGKFLTSEAGYFMVEVNVIKQTTSTVFAGVNSGFNHFIRPMFYDARHDIVNISNTNGRKRIYTIVGTICETDTFGTNRQLSETKPGDLLMFKNAGAYCYSMSSNYNSHFRPAEVMILDRQPILIRKRETFDDLTRGQLNYTN
jgi:diaminopimelate decarboxylase